MSRRLADDRQARAYVRGVLLSILGHELLDRDGWMFGGLVDRCDVDLVTNEIKRMIRAYKRGTR